MPQVVDIPDNNNAQQPSNPAQQSTAFQYAMTDILPAEDEKKNKAVCSNSHNYCMYDNTYQCNYPIAKYCMFVAKINNVSYSDGTLCRTQGISACIHFFGVVATYVVM